MEWIKIVGILISAANFLIMIIGLVAGYMAFKKIITNDLHHVSLDLKDIVKKVDRIDNKLDRHEVDIAVLKEKFK